MTAKSEDAACSAPWEQEQQWCRPSPEIQGDSYT